VRDCLPTWAKRVDDAETDNHLPNSTRAAAVALAECLDGAFKPSPRALGTEPIPVLTASPAAVHQGKLLLRNCGRGDA
jgi:hypothetical protein